jgi:tetratricopeptide (TPR) repeat protein
VAAALDQYATALRRAEEPGASLAPKVLPLYSTTPCWAGQFPTAIEHGRLAVQVARQAHDSDAALLALQVLGLALAGAGRYDEAERTFEEALRFGRDHGIGPFLARSIAMSAGFHLDVFDYAGHAAIAEEAREVARSFSFSPPYISASIDLLLNLARRGEVGRAEALAAEVASAVERAAAWHGWLWRLRFAQARAELALARGDAEGAVGWAGHVLAQSRGRRPKYQALGGAARARGLARLGRTREAIADAQHTIEVARTVGDPALFIWVASTLLDLEGDDQLQSEARGVAAEVVDRLPTDVMRERFRSAEPIHKLGRLTPRV